MEKVVGLVGIWYENGKKLYIFVDLFFMVFKK